MLKKIMHPTAEDRLLQCRIQHDKDKQWLPFPVNCHRKQFASPVSVWVSRSTCTQHLWDQSFPERLGLESTLCCQLVPLTRLLTRAGDLLTSQSKKPAGPPDYTEHSTRNTSQKTSKTSKKQDHKVLRPKTTYTRKTIWKSTSSIFSPSMSPELTSEVRMQRSLSALITPSSISL